MDYLFNGVFWRSCGCFSHYRINISIMEYFGEVVVLSNVLSFLVYVRFVEHLKDCVEGREQ
jgi:hypothetical protein